MLPALSIASTVMNLVKAPLSAILEAYISDTELRRKLKFELEKGLLESLSKSAELQQGVILAEIKSERWLTANWRPLLMLLLMGFLLLVGLVIPIFDWLLGYRVAYEPRWQDLPQGFWEFLGIGVGGYIGGRSLEKITSQVFDGGNSGLKQRILQRLGQKQGKA